MDTVRAFVVDKIDGRYTAEQRDLKVADLGEGDVTVRVERSTVNYKDGLAMTGKAPVVRSFPLVPGIDLAGTVIESSHPDRKPGDKVLLNGWGLGETRHGAYAGLARVRGEWLVPLPDGLSADQAMAIGTAGYTAMLAVLALEGHGIAPSRGAVVVTGAAGGVGSVAIALLARLGYRVVAVTGRAGEKDYLKDLGAHEIVDRQELAAPAKALGRERWAAGIDAVGGNVLANVIAMTSYGGSVAACGNAGGMDLPSSVAPFILRGVCLLGIQSSTAPAAIRREAWGRLARDLDRDKLAAMTRTVDFADIPKVAEEIIAGRVRGRVVVKVAD